MAYLFDPIPRRELPLSKGDDLHFIFVYKPLVTDVEGRPLDENDVPTTDPTKFRYEETDYPSGVEIRLEIDASLTNTIVVPGVIDGSKALFHEDYTNIDPIDVRTGALWRVVMTHPDERDQGLVNGTVVRSDGREL